MVFERQQHSLPRQCEHSSLSDAKLQQSSQYFCRQQTDSILDIFSVSEYLHESDKKVHEKLKRYEWLEERLPSFRGGPKSGANERN